MDKGTLSDDEHGFTFEEYDPHENGSDHYKTCGVEPIDLMRDGEIFHNFAIGSIMKYAFRTRTQSRRKPSLNVQDLTKIIDYAEKLRNQILVSHFHDVDKREG